jgi:rRNA maturation endonuclease Nob1
MNINQEIEKEEMKVQNLVKDWHSQKLVSFIDDLIKKDRDQQLILSGVVKSLPNKYCPQCGEPIKKPHKFWCESKS